MIIALLDLGCTTGGLFKELLGPARVFLGFLVVMVWLKVRSM